MILIDYRDRRPIYEQVVEKMADLMIRGILPQDSQLPSVRSLATDLAITQYDSESLCGIRASGLYLFCEGKGKLRGGKSPNQRKKSAGSIKKPGGFGGESGGSRRHDAGISGSGDSDVREKEKAGGRRRRGAV